MSSQHTGGYQTGPDITGVYKENTDPHLRLKLTADGFEVAAATDLAIGVSGEQVVIANDPRGLVHRRTAGHLLMRAVTGAEFARGAKVFAAAAGKVAATGTILEGFAAEPLATDEGLVLVEPAFGLHDES